MFNQPVQPIFPPHSDWYDLDEKGEGWDKEREKNRECEEKELKDKKWKKLRQKPITDSYYPPSPHYMPSPKGDTVTPAHKDTLVPAPNHQEVEEEEKSIKEEDKTTESDYNSDDIVKIISV